MPIIPSSPTPVPRTVGDLINSALRLIGVLSSEENPSAATANDSLIVFQDLVDSWNAERLTVYFIPRLVFSLTAGKQTYIYGSPVAGNPTVPDFNSPRPAAIERMGIINLNNPIQPLELPLQYLTVAQWQEIPVKNIQSALPQYCWDDQDYPFRNLSFWPVPNVPIQTAIYPWTALVQPAALSTQIAFPPGYFRALRYNLAVDLAAEFPVVPQQVLGPVMKTALEAKAIVKTMNTPIIDLRCDPAIVSSSEKGLYNWLSDMPAGR
jgi:hypothetical protein